MRLPPPDARVAPDPGRPLPLPPAPDGGEVPGVRLAGIDASAPHLGLRALALPVVVQPAGYDPPVPQGPVIALPGGGNDPDRWTPN